MGLLSIKDLQAGMVLADDVKDQRGRLLMTRGTALTEKHLKILKMWGILEAPIEGVSGDEIQASALNDFDPATIAAASASVHGRFCHADRDHPAIRELVRLCIRRAVEGKKSDPVHAVPVFGQGEEITEGRYRKGATANPLKFIDENTRLSTLPDIYRQLLDTLARTSSSNYDIENVINKDTNLSARLLKIVNSAFYGYPAKIDTISRAISIIGISQLSTLAMGVSIICIFKEIPSHIVNMKMFWKHSVLCGICARILAVHKNIRNTERMFTAGLLHDIGRLICYNHLPDESREAIKTASRDRRLLYLIERDLFGVDHTTIGGNLVERWQLPPSLENMVRHHHDPQSSKNPLEPSILHLADIVANAMGIGTSGERLIPPLQPGAWAQIDLTPHVFSSAMEQAERQLEDIFEMITPDDQSQQKK